MTGKLRLGMLALLFVAFLCAGCETKALPSGRGAVWNLVVIGDSSLWDVGEAYAARIEQDLGVKVEVADFTINAATAGAVLATLQTGKSASSQLEALPAAIKEAEVVVVFVNPDESIDPKKPLNFNGCFYGQAPEACEPERFEKWTEHLKGIWAEIIKLRKGKATILRAVDLFNPLVSIWNEKGVFEACTACWVNMSNAVRLAAEAYQIPFASRLAAFNGPDYREDPRLKGYIRDDGEHLSELGVQATVELLAQLGYEPVVAP